jgi:hypothetical protein
LPYFSRAKVIIGVMPMSGASALAHGLRGVRFSSASRQRAERSFCCARGMPRAARTLSAAAIWGFLGGPPLRSHPLPERNQLRQLRISKELQVGRVHLGVTAESPKILIDGCGIQEERQPVRNVGIYARAARVKYVEVILKADRTRAEHGGINDVGYDATALFFR